MSEIAVVGENWEETFFPLVWEKCQQLCEEARQSAGLSVILGSQSLDDISGITSLARDECLKSLEAIKGSKSPMIAFADEFQRLTGDIVTMYCRVVGIDVRGEDDVDDAQ